MNIIPKLIMIATLLLAIGTCGYKVRTASLSTSESSTPTHSLNLHGIYSLVMRQEGGREFDHGKAKTYKLHSDPTDAEVLLISRDSGGIFGKSTDASMRFNPHTLRGTWSYNLGGVVQGGEIHLNQTQHGFEFRCTNTIGPYAGSPDTYGNLIALP